MIYFEIPNFMIKRIYIVKEGNKLVYKKLVGNKYILLNNEEIKEVEKYLNRNSGSKYYSEKLNTIIASNPSISSNSNYLKSFLEYLEKIIPQQAIDTFYHNLQTLKVELNLEVLNEPITDKVIEGRRIVSYYDIENNVLVIDKDNIKQYQRISQAKESPQDFFWQCFNHDLIHELFHIASSKKIGNKFICGFDSRPATFSYEQNRGFTEGFTEILACNAIPLKDEIASGYYIEGLLINQLMLVIGSEVMLESYFNNLGIKKMVEKLYELDPDIDEALILFRFIEVNFNLENIFSSNILSHIELNILKYFKLKIYQDILYDVKKEDILQSIDDYKSFLVTSEIVNYRKESMAKYDGIEEVLDEFISFEKEVKEKLASRNS